jgi:intracellular septation protein
MFEDQLPKWVKPLLEFGPIIAFFIAYTRMKDHTYSIGGIDYQGFIVVTLFFIPLLLFSTGVLWALTKKISPMQIITAILVTVFGGLTVWFNDEQFIKMKPSIIYLLFGGILGFGLLRGQSYLRMIMQDMIPLKEEGWIVLTRRFAVFFFSLALLNEIIWRFFSTEMWVYFKTFGLTIALFAFFVLQGSLLNKYAIEKKE